MVRIPDPGPPAHPDPAPAALAAIDRRMTEAVAMEDWPRFRALLDDMLVLVADSGEPPPAPEPGFAPPFPPPPSPETLLKARRALVEISAAQALAQQQADRLRESIALQDDQSRLAEEAGRNDLSRQARQQSQNARRELAALDEHLAGIARQQNRLTQALRRPAVAPGNPIVEAELAALKAAAAPAANPERKL